MAISKIYKGNTDVTAQFSKIYKGSELFWEKQTGPIMVEITFKDMNGATIITQNIEVGALVTPPTSPIRTSYEFLGWVKETDTSNTIINFSLFTVQESVTFIPLWLLKIERTTAEALCHYGSATAPNKYIGATSGEFTQNNYYLVTTGSNTIFTTARTIQGPLDLMFTNANTTTPTSWTNACTISRNGTTLHNMQARKVFDSSSSMYSGEWRDLVGDWSGKGVFRSRYEEYHWFAEKFFDNDISISNLNTTHFVYAYRKYTLTNVTATINSYGIR